MFEAMHNSYYSYTADCYNQLDDLRHKLTDCQTKLIQQWHQGAISKVSENVAGCHLKAMNNFPVIY